MASTKFHPLKLLVFMTPKETKNVKPTKVDINFLLFKTSYPSSNPGCPCLLVRPKSECKIPYFYLIYGVNKCSSQREFSPPDQNRQEKTLPLSPPSANYHSLPVSKQYISLPNQHNPKSAPEPNLAVDRNSTMIRQVRKKGQIWRMVLDHPPFWLIPTCQRNFTLSTNHLETTNTKVFIPRNYLTFPQTKQAARTLAKGLSTISTFVLIDGAACDLAEN